MLIPDRNVRFDVRRCKSSFLCFNEMCCAIVFFLKIKVIWINEVNLPLGCQCQYFELVEKRDEQKGNQSIKAMSAFYTAWNSAAVLIPKYFVLARLTAVCERAGRSQTDQCLLASVS